MDQPETKKNNRLLRFFWGLFPWLIVLAILFSPNGKFEWINMLWLLLLLLIILFIVLVVRVITKYRNEEPNMGWEQFKLDMHFLNLSLRSRFNSKMFFNKDNLMDVDKELRSINKELY